MADASNSPVVRLVKVYAGAQPVRKAEKSAAGALPAGAFQYCEAMRQASSYGWYVYPPKDISLFFDGTETYVHDVDQWTPVKSQNFEDEFRAAWNGKVPEPLKGYDPPFLSELFVPGSVQLWSGYLAETKPDWGLLIRPTVNTGDRLSLVAYEGIVEADRFRPFPLFINFRILKTDVEIYVPKDRPLFQIQPIYMPAYRTADQNLIVEDLFADETPDVDWAGFGATIRRDVDMEAHRPGRYAVETRRKKT